MQSMFINPHNKSIKKTQNNLTRKKEDKCSKGQHEYTDHLQQIKIIKVPI